MPKFTALALPHHIFRINGKYFHTSTGVDILPQAKGFHKIGILGNMGQYPKFNLGIIGCNITSSTGINAAAPLTHNGWNVLQVWFHCSSLGGGYSLIEGGVYFAGGGI